MKIVRAGVWKNLFRSWECSKFAQQAFSSLPDVAQVWRSTRKSIFRRANDRAPFRDRGNSRPSCHFRQRFRSRPATVEVARVIYDFSVVWSGFRENLSGWLRNPEKIANCADIDNGRGFNGPELQRDDGNARFWSILTLIQANLLMLGNFRSNPHFSISRNASWLAFTALWPPKPRLWR